MAEYLITSPEGKQYRVKGHGTKQEAFAALQEQLGAQPDETYDKGNYLTNTIDSITNGLTGGLGAKITAGEAALLGKTPEGDWFNYEKSMGERYDDALKAERKQNANFKKTNPVTAYGAEIGAAVLPFSKAAQLGNAAIKSVPMANVVGNAAVKMAPKAAPFAGRVLGNATVGSAFGLSQAYGQDTDLQEGLTTGAIFGGLGQVGGEVLGKTLGKVASKFNKPKIIPSSNLHKAGDAQFEAAKQIAKNDNVIYSKNSMKKMQREVLSYFMKRGFRKKNEPGAHEVLKGLKDAVKNNHTLEGLLSLRKEFSNSYRFGANKNPNNNKMVRKAIDLLDDLIGDQSAILPGPSSAARVSNIVKEGRKLKHTAYKLGDAEKALKNAKEGAGVVGSGGNVANKTLQNMRKILDKNPRGYTPAEMKALEKAASPSLMQQVTRQVGKLSPTGNGLMAGLHVVGAGTMPLATIPVAAAGLVSKAAFNAITKGNANELLRVISNGNVKLPKSTIQQLLENPEIQAQIGRALAAGSLVAID